MLRCGLLGKTLGHSFSPQIHGMLADYQYRLYPCLPEDLESFIQNGAWDALNVTVPYKKEVLRYCTQLSETARRIGSVNTLVRLPNGGLFGDNTDAFGFERMVRKSGLSVQEKKVLVLGTGGTSATVCDVLRRLQAQIVVVSRNGENHYRNLYLHADARMIVNTTPVGMYPNNGEQPLDLSLFDALEGVLDVIYNPLCTALLMQARERGLIAVNGLGMLVAQAKRSSEIFTGRTLPDSDIDRIEQALAEQQQNIVLIGMPGCGKSTVADLLGQQLNRSVYDTDALIEQKAGMPIPRIFEKYGEAYFRDLEAQVIAEIGKVSGAVISTGGGCVLREQNYLPLAQNGSIVWLQRPIEQLAIGNRPLSKNADLQQMYEQRKERYAALADCIVTNQGDPQQVATDVLQASRKRIK